MTICRFGVGGNLKLLNQLVALGDLLPLNFAVQKFQTLIVEAGNQWHVTDVTVRDCPLYGRVEGVKVVSNKGDSFRWLQNNTHAVISIDLE